MIKFAFGLALASMLSLASGSKTRGSRMQTYKASCLVRVTNLTFKQDFSAAIIVAHEKGSRPLFSEGAKARNGISMLAEEGLSGNVQNIATRESGFCGFATPASNGLIFPGKTWEGKITFDANKCKDPVYSVVAKLDDTNNAFMGIAGSKFPTGSCPSKHFPPAFDAGSETNNEKCTCMPGRACPESTRDAREIHGRNSEGFIHVHRGFQGVEDLSKDYGWQNPVAVVVVSKA
ncbi:unnamed protein product [Ectocarpus sp. 8 AP-2014]